MFDKITQKIKNEPSCGFLFILTSALVLIFATLFSFCILQSDDYSYAAYFKEGLAGFLNLTKEHFLDINGRALVHFFLHITLALPTLFAVLIKSAILFSVGFFSFKASRLETDRIWVYLIAFYSLLMLSGNNTFKEAVMWTSGFFNYVFPAFFVLFALYLHAKGSNWQYLFCALAGATTEQWGITAFVIITVSVIASALKFRTLKPTAFIPSLAVLLGYVTIFLSPATRSRISVSGHIALSESLFDITRLSQAFLSKGSSVAVIVIFILVTILTAYLKKGLFQALYAGTLPLFLILTLPLHGSYMASFLIFVCYLLLCALLFFTKKHAIMSAYIFGALTSIIIMLPTNTFDSRITFSAALLLILASITFILELDFTKKALTITVASLLSVALIAFYPSYMGFYKNFAVEKLNLDAIKIAKETKILNYCIDYNKDYAVRQMFNDGWFYNAFISLYDLEDCKIIIESENSVSFDSIKTKGLMHEGDIYLPVREFLDEKGGNITSDEGILMELNDKTLTYFDGIFAYKNTQGKEVYLNADKNRIPDFYTLYIKLSVINEAFDLNIKAL